MADKVFIIPAGEIAQGLREKTVCKACDQGGGRMRFVNGEYYHVPGCKTMSDERRDGARSTFPFTTTMLDGRETTVQSLGHLRRLEREHGVNSVAYNNNESNW